MLWRWLFIMATVIVANLTIFSDDTGRPNQGHLVYAANQQRWWCFVRKTKAATTISAYVSSSNDLTTATWAEATGSPSPAFPSSHALGSTAHSLFGAVGLTNSTTDAAHVDAVTGSSPTQNVETIRCTFTGSATVAWDAAWNEFANASSNGGPDGVITGVSGTSHNLHEYSLALAGSNTDVRVATNADSTATWTNGWAAATQLDAVSSAVHSGAFAPLASDLMLFCADNAAVATPNCTNIRWEKSATATTWTANSAADVFTSTVTQNNNDWCLCRVDDTHVYCFRRSAATTYDWRVFNGTSWATPANGVPNQASLAGGGIFAASDGASLWLFVLDSATNNPIQYCKASSANGTTPTWGTWTQLETAGTTARSSISGCVVVNNNQIGVIFTAVNGSNFDIMVTALSTVALSASVTPSYQFYPKPKRSMSLIPAV